MKGTPVKKLTLTAMFLALGFTLPFLTGQIQQIGNLLLPMHLPVFLCALICGWEYGLPMALILPLARSLIFGMPPLFPTAVAMALELGTYAFVAGFLYGRAKWQCIRMLYLCLVTAMLAGRFVWGAVMALLLGFGGDGFTLSAFLAGAFTNAVPGIVLQLILIPAILLALHRTKLVPMRKSAKPADETA